MKLISRMPRKVLASVAGVLTIVGLVAAANAWYPDRPTYTVAHPADHVTFNSITDNPREGDERAFFEVKNAANTNSDGFAHSTVVNDGEEVLLRVYVHNNAADNLNGTNFNGPGVAKNTQVRVWLPSVTDSVMRANAYVSADNAQPKVVSDTVDFAAPTTAQKFSLEYVKGSAVAYNNAVGQTGMKLSDNIVTTGALIGYQKADGIVPGCFQYVNVITLKVKVHMQTPGYTMSKTVATKESNGWKKSVTANAGETVAYQINFNNTGSSTLNDVVVRDQLPAGIKLVSGSVKLFNTIYPSGTSLSDAVVSNGGQNIGAYAAKSNGFVQFKATVPAENNLKCGLNTFTNIGEVRANGGAQTDTAVVTVNKQCQEVPPAYTCNLLTLTKGDNRTVTAKVEYTATPSNTVTLKTVTYNFGDSSTPLVTDKTTVDHQYKADGQYRVTATLSFDVNGAQKSGITSTNCAQVVSYTTPGVPPTPTVLPSTGPEGVAGIVAATSAFGAVAHRVITRRANRD